MPRKSQAALLVPAMPKREMPRPDAPYDLNEAEGAIWNAIVGAMPADYFNAAQLPMLASLCTCVAEKRLAKAEIDAERAKARPRKKVLDGHKRDFQRFADLEQRLMRNMRLTHQSVILPQTAGSRQRAEREQQSVADELWEDAEA